MKLEDLLEMLRVEFALDVPAAELTLSQWAALPSQPPSGLPDMLSFLERSSEVVQIVGMQGFASFLQRVRAFSLHISAPDTVFSSPGTGLSSQFTPQSSVQWLGQWLPLATAYLAKPADADATQAIAKYLYRCPQRPKTDEVLALAALLRVPPVLPSDDPDSAELEAAQDADVALPTADVDGDLLQALLIDAPQQLEQLEGTLQLWAQGAISEAQLLEAQRISHTFKGSGNIIGLPGVGRIAHRLEDILEHALALVKGGERANPAMARDSLRAVSTLQQMVAFLQGEDAAPHDAKIVLQRLLDWVQLIRDDRASTASLEPLDSTAAPLAFASAVQEFADSAHGQQAVPAVGLGQAPAAAPQAIDAVSLRVGVDRLSRMLRRAGQSIVQTQRLAQLLQNTTDRLGAVDASQKLLQERLKQLESLVGVQAVALREHQKEGDLDPLELDRYDALHVLSRSITEAAEDGQQLVSQISSDTQSASAVLRDEAYALVDQHRELLTARLVPAKTMVPRLKRNVAQTASATGKQVELTVRGDEVMVDADVLTRLTDPMLHLLRNAVDHGIETPGERRALGKSAHGTVDVLFSRAGQEVEIVVSDDGRGLDLEGIYEKAVSFGLVAAGAVLPDAELRRMILRPGFSTRNTVTEVSGRGVGMDVVNDRVTALKGRLQIDSSYSKGSRFTLRVPVSSGVTHALIVVCAQESIALSSDQVITVLAAGQGEFSGDAALTLSHDGQSYPAFRLAQWLGFEEQGAHAAASTPIERAQAAPAVLVKGADGPVALLVDQVIDSREIILQGIGQLTRRIRGLVGGALRPDGRPLFLLDVAELERAARSSVSVVSSAALRRRLQVERTRVLVVDDALSVRRSMQQLLGDAGYEVALANDGFEAIEQIRLKLPALILTDLEMPNLNGLELTRRVREVGQWSALPVVMITSRAGDKHRALASEAGVNVYLTKPYLDADLLAHVRQLCAASA